VTDTHFHHNGNCYILSEHAFGWSPFWMHWNTLTEPDQTSHDGQLGKVHIAVNIMWKYRLDIIVDGEKP